MLIKTYQLICAFLGGSVAIYTGLKSGYGIGFIGLVSAYAGTRLMLWASDCVTRSKSRYKGALRRG